MTATAETRDAELYQRNLEIIHRHAGEPATFFLWPWLTLAALAIAAGWASTPLPVTHAITNAHPVWSTVGMVGQCLFTGRFVVQLYFSERAGRPVNPLFDDAWYLQQNPDVRLHLIDPYKHYVNNGRFEGRQPNIMFDPLWYLSVNSDVVAAGQEPLDHYWKFGAYEGRLPHALFPWRFTDEELESQRANGQTPLGLYLNEVRQKSSQQH